MERRKISRKFLVAIVGAAVVLLGDLFGLQVSPEAQSAIVTLLALWLVGESAVDAADRLGGHGRD